VDRVRRSARSRPFALLRLLEIGDRLRVDAAAVAGDLRRQLHALRLKPLLLARCATSFSTSGRISCSSSLASLGVK
jgi:hypothetical protein